MAATGRTSGGAKRNFHEEYFKGVAYEPYDMWTRWSVSVAHVIILSFYFLVVLAGTLALAGAGRLVANAQAGL
jgi:hypothetical protein